jgi:ubiquitin C-terminal hydrolase
LDREEKKKPVVEGFKVEVPDELKDKANVYELYSIMIHQGGSSSGHYFAYIKVRFAC